jgi:1,4-alpha-glucan branching enzyme
MDENIMKKKITFKHYAPEAGKVFLAGSFNGWNASANPLKKNKDGSWSILLNLFPGNYEYRFFVDGKWTDDQTCKKHHVNKYGGHNCVLIVD